MMTDSMRLVWEKAKEAIRSQVPDQGYLMWIDPLRVVKAAADSVVLGCPNPLAKKWLMDHYRGLLESAMQQAAQRPLKVLLEVAECAAEAPETPEEAPQQLCLPAFADIPRPSSGRLLNRDFTFDSFVVGDCNDFAYSAALSVASKRSKLHAPLYLLAQTGLGKSHLSQAVGRQVMQESPEERVFYITAEDFTNEMIGALNTGTISSFKEKYRRNCDTLILEDVHFLSGKNRTQDELAFTLDSLMETNKRLVFTSAYLPSEIPKMHDSMRSRLNAGVISSLEAPDFRMRMRILQRKANSAKIALPMDVAEFMASELTGDIRHLESGIKGLAARNSIMGRGIDLKMAREVVGNIVRNRKALTLGVITKMVCKYYRVTEEDLRSRSRKQAIARPRQVAMYLGRRYTDQSLQAIGRTFNRYHATALHAVGVVERHIRENGDMREPVLFLCGKIEAGEF
ncbi:chromosomal replication initiator protein DnaA [Desulfatibacillum aliphaticivorans]|uniref:chromosomal replication initiator protein DnaA n=1 Tax=Desulfatibacillum aliphaticivorans TaxID=218208 RepID=UPI000684ECA5|nr:chromosomal replication initiator protein DnaA [Desulfatibacillum aliphaticivorans]